MLDQITDIHLCEHEPRQSLMFPGPVLVPEEALGVVIALTDRCKATKKRDFLVSLDGVFFRGRREEFSVDGTWYSLRRIPSAPPDLSHLPSPIPQAVIRMLMSSRLRTGGLVYICGAPGSGKTTTASATVVSRLREYGGFAYTIEDPPELPLHGWHGQGFCRQTWVSDTSYGAWAETMRGLVRSQPANTPVILFVGEVRDTDSAQAMLRAAANGFLVLATGFATDIPSGLEALATLVGDNETALATLASTLKLVLHQRLRDGAVVAQFLALPEPSCPPAIKLRAGQFQHLVSDIQFQANRAMLGEILL